MLPLMPTGIDADAETPMPRWALAERLEVERGGGSLPRPQTSSYPLLGSTYGVGVHGALNHANMSCEG